MKRLCQVLIILLMAFFAIGCSGKTIIPETDETVDNWVLARRYQAAGRYELAKQHYGLALAAVRTQSSLDMLKRELVAVEMQLRAMR
jgi:hypothetical protein